MVEKYIGYCVKDKKKVEIVNGKISRNKRGIRMVKGKCPKCGITVCRILGK